MSQCEFCQNTYTSISALNYHKKTAKYCLKIQNEINSRVSLVPYLCEFCNKEFTKQIKYKKHVDVCKIKVNNEKNTLNTQLEILKKEYEEKISQLNQKIIELEKLNIALETRIECLTKPSVTNPNTTNSHTAIYNGNVQTNNQYNNFQVKIDELPCINNFVEDLISEEEFKNSLWASNEKRFMRNLSSKMNEYMFFTDKARGNVLYKELLDNEPKAIKSTLNNFIKRGVQSEKLLEEIKNFKDEKLEEVGTQNDEDTLEKVCALTCIYNIMETVIKENKTNKNLYEPVKKFLNDNGRFKDEQQALT